MRWAGLASVSLLSLVGCGSLQGVSDVETAVAPAPAEAPDAAPPSCRVVTTELFAVFDTGIFFDSSSCNGQHAYGVRDAFNVGVGAGAIRFMLDQTDIDAFEQRTVVGATLIVDTQPHCALECPPQGLQAIAGVLSASAMRSDWEEGVGGTTGADGCRRNTNGDGWGKATAAGPSTHIAPKFDYDEIPAGFTNYADGAAHVEVPLTAEALAAFRDAKGDAHAAELSLYVKSTAQIMIASREAGAAARLRITRCE